MPASSFDATSPAGLPNAGGLPPIPHAELLGTSLALVDYERALDWIDAAVAVDARAYVCVAAVHTVMEAREDPALRAAVAGSAFTVPDGMPLAWGLRALGHDITTRVYGPDLMAHSLARSAATGQRHFLYGGRDSDADALPLLERRLRERFPGLVLAGSYQALYRPLSDAELDAVAAAINAARPDVVWVGLGVPRQEKWMAAIRSRLDAPVLVGVGAAFDFHAGLVPQAPPWMQRAGLEWLFRLRQEPRRLWRRYARHNPRFVLGFARQWLAERRR
jgi:N-acetylglucosaminyldiphosphoundecaprenol N-acetyl-beta-D-mannosaminyltransferase